MATDEQPVASACPECGEPPLVVQGVYGPVTVDACFGGLIEGSISACCGHGGRKPAYVRLHVGHGRYIDICGGTIVPYRDFVAEWETVQAEDGPVTRRKRPSAALLDDVDRALTAYGVAFSKTEGPTQEQRDEWFEQGRLALRRVRDALAVTTEGGTMNLAERAIASSRAAEFTAETREKVAAALAAPEGEREELLADALASAVEALRALTELLLDAREEAS